MAKPGKTERYIKDKLQREGALLFALFDPVDHPDPQTAGRKAGEAVEAGADLILVGGSIGAQGALLDETIVEIKDKINGLPLVLFPGNLSTVSGKADAIYFMSLLNSRNPYWITMAQALAAPVITRIGLETLPVGYIVVSPGGTVGWVGDANMVPRHKPGICASLAMAGELSGSRFIVTDVGSAAPDPVPLDMIKMVRKAVNPEVPYICAGGIKTPDQAKAMITAGADAIHIGTVIEKSDDVKKTLGEYVKAIKIAGKAKV